MPDRVALAEMIRDPAWQFAGVLLALLAVVVTLFLAWRRRLNKDLSYTIKSTLLVSVHDQVREKVKILYQNEPVRDVRLVEFHLRNSGTVPVEPRDFMDPLYLEFGESSRVLSAQVQATDPEDLSPEVASENPSSPHVHGRVAVQPLLMNPGDSLTLTALVAGSPSYEIRARISGIRRLGQEGRTSRLRLLLLGALAGAAIGMLGRWLPLSDRARGILDGFFAGLLFLGVLVAFFYRSPARPRTT